MIPSDNDILTDVVVKTQPSYTYAMDMNSMRVIGNNDRLDAIKQAVYKILNTERYHTPIYSWNYGVEFADLVGKPTTYCVPEIERRIKEALMQDDRIKDVYGFSFTFPKKGVIETSFTVDTIEGSFIDSKGVDI